MAKLAAYQRLEDAVEGLVDVGLDFYHAYEGESSASAEDGIRQALIRMVELAKKEIKLARKGMATLQGPSQAFGASQPAGRIKAGRACSWVRERLGEKPPS